MNLNQIASKHDTDKVKFHRFVEHYDNYLRHIREGAENILELGIFQGHSVRMWRDYFENATIYAVDNNALTKFEDEKIVCGIMDETDYEGISNLTDGKMMDMIIDDGSHIPANQISGLKNLLPKVKPGGFYIIEDLHSKTGDGGTEVDTSAIDFVRDLQMRIPPNGDDADIVQLRKLIDYVVFVGIDTEQRSNSLTAIIHRK